LQNNYQQNKQDTCGTGDAGPSLFDTLNVSRYKKLVLPEEYI